MKIKSLMLVVCGALMVAGGPAFTAAIVPNVCDSLATKIVTNSTELKGTVRSCKAVCVAFARRSVFSSRTPADYRLTESPEFFQDLSFSAIPANFKDQSKDFYFYYNQLSEVSGVEYEIVRQMDYAAENGTIIFDISTVDLSFAQNLVVATKDFMNANNSGNRSAALATKRILLDLANQGASGTKGVFTEWELARMAFFGYLEKENVRVFIQNDDGSPTGKVRELTLEERKKLQGALTGESKK